MSGGSEQPQQQTQTSTFKMSPEQRRLFELGFPGIREFANMNLRAYPGSQVAPFTGAQEKGQRMAVRGAAPIQGVLGREGAEANNFLLQDIWNPSTNPYLQQAIGAATHPITEQFRETVLPAINDEFQGAGQQFGGSRRGVAEGIASGRYLDSIGDTASQLVQGQYGNNLEAMVRGLGLLPSTMAAQTIPAQTVSGVGDIRQRMNQALLNERVGGFNFEQYAPFLQGKEVMGLISGIPGGTNMSTASLPPQPPWWMQSLGGASAGAGIGGGFGPWGAPIGAGIGALLPFLS